jgi:hypothetical protein
MHSPTAEMIDKYSPEFIRPLEQRDSFIVPTKMLAAVATKGHPPTISRKPGMSLGGWTVSNCTRAGIEGVKIAFHSGGVYETVSVCRTYTMKPIRVSDQGAARNALICFGTVATNSVYRRSRGEHIWFQREVGCVPGKITDCLEMSI